MEARDKLAAAIAHCEKALEGLRAEYKAATTDTERKEVNKEASKWKNVLVILR